ncbi:MAG: GNAT family N-acetyltransferase [Parachlamydiaceae bacterium]|nr:MAG: GNAT family N-acetyltransferase [Parachlamydiaceae bacterium]
MRTKRLLLRHWQESDLKPFADMNADHRVREYFPNLLSEEESNASIEQFQRDLEINGFGFWAIELLEEKQFIGFCGINHVKFDSHFTPCIEIGWRLAAQYWGHGYATEAAQEALKCGFSNYNFHEIVAFTAVYNKRSRRVMEKLGMHRSEKDDFDHPKIEKGKPVCRQVLYRIFQKEWNDRPKFS